MSESVDIIGEIKKNFPPGAVVYKTTLGTAYKLRDWKIRRDGLYAMYYRISGASSKSIPAQVFKWAHEKLLQGQDVKASDCLAEFYSVFGSNSCNFNVLGGVFERLGYAEQQRGIIVSKCNTAS